MHVFAANSTKKKNNFQKNIRITKLAAACFELAPILLLAGRTSFFLSARIPFVFSSFSFHTFSFSYRLKKKGSLCVFLPKFCPLAVKTGHKLWVKEREKERQRRFLRQSLSVSINDGQKISPVSRKKNYDSVIKERKRKMKLLSAKWLNSIFLHSYQ